MSDADLGVPKDLDINALAKLGRFTRPIQAYVRRLNSIRWLGRVNNSEPWDDKVQRVFDLEHAKEIEKTFRPVRNEVWKAMEEIGKQAGRFELMEAAEDYWIIRFDPRYDQHAPSYTHDLLLAEIHTDIVGALREIVIGDIVPIHFYRNAINWYEKGHFRAAFTADGKPIIY